MTTHIMVIDDEPLIGRLLRYQLGDAGYSVAAFQNGREAILHLGQEQPDLVLLDVMMPDINGYDLCKEIRAFCDTPIIMLTAKHGDDDIVLGLTLGADDYIGKPFNAPQLIARIEAVLRRSKAKQPQPSKPRQPAIRPRNPAQAVPPFPVSSQALPLAEPAPLVVEPKPTKQALPRLGPALAAARHYRGLSLHEAGQACSIRWEFLQAIEQEQFSFVPRPQLREALRTYSKWLGVDLSPYLAPRPTQTHMLQSRLAVTAMLIIMFILVIAVLVL